MAALALECADMETVSAERKVAQAQTSKLPPDTSYDIKTGDDLKVYKERRHSLC